MNNRQIRGSAMGTYAGKKRKKKMVRGKQQGNGKRMTREQLREIRRKERRKKVFIARFICAIFICMTVGIILWGVRSLTDKEETVKTGSLAERLSTIFYSGTDWTMDEMFGMLEEDGIVCTQDFLTLNEYSRPGDELGRVKNIFVHYTANPGTNAAQNKSYFQNLAETHETSASSHFIIGYEGEIVQCVPLEEIAYAVAGRNNDSISIECCYVDESGVFTEKTYQTLVKFSAILLEKYGLKSKDLMRHYDDNGKICPKYYVENGDAWWQFVDDVEAEMKAKE